MIEKEKLKSLIESSGLSVNAIEKKLKMPQGTLAKVINGVRELPAKWEAPVVKFLTPKTLPVKTDLKTLLPKKNTNQTNGLSITPIIVEHGPVTPRSIQEYPNVSNHLVETDEEKEKRAFGEAKIRQQLKRLEQYEHLEHFCNMNNCTPQDLIDSYSPEKKLKKPDASLAEFLPKNLKVKPMGGYMAERQKLKLGI